MDLKSLLKMMGEKNASDLHVRSDHPAVFRVDGNLTLKTPEPIPAEQVAQWIKSLLSDSQARSFEERLECDLALTVEGLGRFRVNVYRQQGVINIAIRNVPAVIPTFEQLKRLLIHWATCSAGIGSGVLSVKFPSTR